MKNFFLISLLSFSFLGGAQAQTQAPKKFKRALVLGGMGISPALGVGVIAGLKKAGWVPDLVMVTCGASMSAIIYNSFPNVDEALAYMKTEKFQEMVNMAQIRSKNLIKMKKSFDRAKNLGIVPPIFDRTLLVFPEHVDRFMPAETLGNESTKFVILAAKASFGPESVGLVKEDNKYFTQTFFTDPDTAKSLESFDSPIHEQFPDSRVHKEILIRTDIYPEMASRASISDPFLIPPAKIDGEYYFTGAIDLFPLEMAQSLADEVISNYPLSLFTEYEDLAIESTFGFKQTNSVLHDIQNKEVKWIDFTGAQAVKFDPVPHHLIFIRSGIPFRPVDFQAGIQAQWDLGFKRAVEAVTTQMNGPSTKHLRTPINSVVQKAK